jgi:hypothetical protein
MSVSIVLIRYFAALATYNLIYETDLINGSCLALTDLKTLAADVSCVPLQFVVSTFYVSLVEQDTSTYRNYCK